MDFYCLLLFIPRTCNHVNSCFNQSTFKKERALSIILGWQQDQIVLCRKAQGIQGLTSMGKVLSLLASIMSYILFVSYSLCVSKSATRWELLSDSQPLTWWEVCLLCVNKQTMRIERIRVYTCTTPQ